VLGDRPAKQKGSVSNLPHSFFEVKGGKAGRDAAVVWSVETTRLGFDLDLVLDWFIELP
jgi:hypothetical protein